MSRRHEAKLPMTGYPGYKGLGTGGTIKNHKLVVKMTVKPK